MPLAESNAGGPAKDFHIDLNPYFSGLMPSPTLAVNERVAELRREGRTVYHLGFGESRFPVHSRLAAALQQHSMAKSYLAAQGLPELRETVARYYTTQLRQPFGADQVIVGPGSKALIFAVQMAMSADLFLPSPSWVSYEPQAQMLGKRVSYIPSRVENDHALDLDALDALLAGSSTPQRLLILNSPNNPTGMMLDEASLQALAGFCRERNVVVLSDEIYFRVRQDREHHSIARYYPEGTIILGGLSKHLSIGGWRLGVALVPDHDAGRRLLGAMTAIASEIWSAVASPVQHAAVIAYAGDPDIEDYTATCSAVHALRTRFLRDGLITVGIRCTPAEGAFYLTANFDRWRTALAERGVKTSQDLAEYLIEEFSIATLPCSVFGLPPETLSLRLASSYLDMESDDDGSRVLNAYQANPATLMSEQHHPRFHACIAAFGAFIASLEGTAGS